MIDDLKNLPSLSLNKTESEIRLEDTGYLTFINNEKAEDKSAIKPKTSKSM